MDDRLRRLERAALTGEPEALKALARERCRVYGHMLIPYFGSRAGSMEGLQVSRDTPDLAPVLMVTMACIRTHCGYHDEETTLKERSSFRSTVPTFYMRRNQRTSPLIRLVHTSDWDIDIREFIPINLNLMQPKPRWLTWVFWRSSETPDIPCVYSMPMTIVKELLNIHQDEDFSLLLQDIRISREDVPGSPFPRYRVHPVHPMRGNRDLTEGERKWLGRDLFSDWGTI